MSEFIVGALIFGFGVLVGAALVQATINRIIDADKD